RARRLVRGRDRLSPRLAEEDAAEYLRETRRREPAHQRERGDRDDREQLRRPVHRDRRTQETQTDQELADEAIERRQAADRNGAHAEPQLGGRAPAGEA